MANLSRLFICHSKKLSDSLTYKIQARLTYNLIKIVLE